MLKTRTIPVTSFQQNATLLWCDQTLEAAISDPGGDLDKLLKAADEEGVKITKILLTHGHLDHAGFAKALAEQTGAPIFGPHKDDAFLLQSMDQYSELLGLPHSGNFLPDQWLKEGATLTLGEETLEVIHCPGHTPGHVVFFNRNGRLAIVGDVLFQGSIGRTDFPRGNHADLLHSIKQKLLPKGDKVTFIPGHGPNSSFGQERRHNPFLQ